LIFKDLGDERIASKLVGRWEDYGPKKMGDGRIGKICDVGDESMAFVVIP
jgi:hypothetical protein